MEKRSPANPTGDYYLLRAKLLDNSGQFEEAVASINKALQATPTRPDFYLQASLFLVKHEKFHEALDLLRQSEKFIAPHPDLLLLQAIVLEMVNFSDDAGRLLEKAQSLWPEWYVPYLIHGIILENQHQAAEARQRLETAVALGGKEPAAYFYLAMAYSDLNPEDNAGAYKILTPALELNPADPYAQTLAGKLNLGMKEYAKAKQHLDEAIRLQPDLSDAHWTLANVYRLTGEQEKQQIELAEVNRLNKLKPAANTAPKLPMKNLLFSVGFPKLSETSGKGNTQ